VGRLCVVDKDPAMSDGVERRTMGVSPFFFLYVPARLADGFAERRETIGSNLNLRENQIESLLTPVVEGLGCELWGVEFMSQGRRSKLRVYVERPEGVTVDDCERVSRDVSDLLDVEDVMPEFYTLEVSSPGLDRILFKAAHYQANVGAVVDVRLNFPVEGTKRIVGVLAALEDDEIIVRSQDDEDEEYVLPLVNIHRARLVPQFD
jgi:ribosome maturation factor RimP